MINESLAHTSNILLYGSLAAYTGALLGYATDLAQSSTKLQRDRSEVRESALVGPAVGGAAPQNPMVDEAKQPPYRRPAAGIAIALTIVAMGLHLGSVVSRGIAAGRAPWGNMFEFATTGAVVVTIVFLAALRWKDLRYLGIFVVGPVLLTLGVAIRWFYVKADNLVPALKSSFLIVHVSVAFIAAGLLTLGFSLVVLYLVQDSREQAAIDGAQKQRSFMDALPSAKELDLTAYRLHALAFPLWSFTLIAGAIWAERSWTRYWAWDAKESWSFVIWVVYAAYLHARATAGWHGRKAAGIAIAGFVCLILNFTVVNIFFPGLHTYGGVGTK